MATCPLPEQTVPEGRLIHIEFDLLSGKEIERSCPVDVSVASDLRSPKLGLPNVSSECATCGSRNTRECEGHFGVVKFPAIIYHPHLISEVVQILNTICPGCRSIKLEKRNKDFLPVDFTDKSMKVIVDDFEVFFRSLGCDVRMLQRFKRTLTSKLSFLTKSSAARLLKVHSKSLKKCSRSEVKKSTISKIRAGATQNQLGCKYCNRNSTAWYPPLKFMILSEDIQGKKTFSVVAQINGKLPKKFRNKCQTDVLPEDYWNFLPNLQQQGSNKNRVSLSPMQVRYLLKELDPEYIKRFVSRPELLFLSCLPVIPNSLRVMETSHVFSDGPRLHYDERTMALRKVVELNKKMDELRDYQHDGALLCSHITGPVLDCLHKSKLHNRPAAEVSATCKYGRKWLQDVVLGKRSDHSFRMVVVGDPKLRLGEIGIPSDICDKLFVAEHVNSYNLKKLNITCNSHLLTRELYARSKGKLKPLHKTGKLKVGDFFYRPLEDGDIVLINRPPSIHQHSLIAMNVKILQSQPALAMNPLSCAPFAGDFDGDCLHGYVAQSELSRIELRELVSMESQLLNVQDGRSLLSLTNDSLTSAYLLTGRDIFLNKFEMQQLEMLCSYLAPCPAIVQSQEVPPLWTGHQLLTALLSPCMYFGTDSGTPENCGEEILSSDLSFWVKKTLPNFVSSMFKCYGKKALDLLFSAQEVLCEWISMRGFTVSLNDIYLSPDSYSRAKMIDEINYALEDAEDACVMKELIMDSEFESLRKCHNENEDPLVCLDYDSSIHKPARLSQASVDAFRDVFYELQYAIRPYIGRENSILSMINAGSQGNMQKLVQQSACLGLQLAPGSLSFPMPDKLVHNLSYPRNEFHSCGMHQNSAGSATGQNYAVIRASFVDGLNPIECFDHAISIRPSLFKENVAKSGSLARKLMFYMRDLYMAYDGTVRSAYGQQLVQFSYGASKEKFIDSEESHELFSDRSIESNAIGGQPVGSMAASSMSEAAYGASDLPTNSLEPSPLMNLKKILECSQSRTSSGTSISLTLSKKLERWLYGFEYGALEVKNHLDRVLFSDLLTNFMIFYDAYDEEGTNCSPWISHFHVDKERLVRKRLTIQAVIEKLETNYGSRRKKSGKVRLPKVHIRCHCCSFLDEEGKNDKTFCITVAVSDNCIMLETIKDSVIPDLLQTLIKGFLEFKKVDIIWGSQIDSNGELFVKVTRSQSCPVETFWSNLTDACIPIMHLIDWERSHPDDICGVYNVCGIEGAWKYLVGALKSTTSDIGRSIHQEHLLLVADCLTVTGKFHGLSARGLTVQRKSASISSPFNQACFSNPRDRFINAAKQGSIDNLYGTVDALAWGKEATLGTGGPFEIIYSGKVHNPKKSESIYETLNCLGSDKSHHDNRPAYRNITAKWKGKSKFAKAHSNTGFSGSNLMLNKVNLEGLWNEEFVKNPGGQAYCHPELHVSDKSELTTFGFNSSPNEDKICSWLDVVDMSSSLRAILNEYEMGESLSEAHKSLLMEALNYHPKREAKLGIGVQDIKIGHSLSHPDSRCFILFREDGTQDDVSYHKCVIGAAKQISPEVGLWAENKLYRRFWSK